MNKISKILVLFALLGSGCTGNSTSSEASSSSDISSSESETSSSESSTSSESTSSESSSSPTVDPTFIDYDDPQIDVSEMYEIWTEDAFSEIRNLVSWKRIKCDHYYFASTYSLVFEMPLDWHDISKGTFEQRAVLSVRDFDAPLVCYTGGYNLDGRFFTQEIEIELDNIIGGNLLSIEHRYFGESYPGDEYEYEGTTYFDYLTEEDSTHDFYFIVKQLKRIFHGKTVFTGGSKGGYDTNLLAYFHPEICDVYVPYVAPNNNGVTDLRGVKFIYEEAGNEAFGEEQAAYYRQCILNFQIYCLVNRDKFIYICKAIEKDSRFTADQIYELSLGSIVFSQWQYDLYPLEFFEEFSTIDNDSYEYTFAKEILQNCIGVSYQDSMMISYVVEARKEMGSPIICYSYLREAIKDIPDTYISIQPEEEEYFYYLDSLTPEQIEYFQYNPTLNNSLNEWVNTTDCHILMINGAMDPWNAMRIDDPKEPRDNIVIITDPYNCHNTKILDLPSKLKNLAINTLEDWLELKIAL